MKEAKGCGYRHDKLHIFVEEIMDQEKKETIESDIKKILLGNNISDFIVSSSTATLTLFDKKSTTHTHNDDIGDAKTSGKASIIVFVIIF